VLLACLSELERSGVARVLRPSAAIDLLQD
jgi:hypothetical protein